MKKIKNFISGKVDAVSLNYIEVDDPSKGEVIAEVVNSNDKDFEKLIESSKKGFKIWNDYTPLKRSRIISKFKNNIENNIDNLAKLVSFTSSIMV